MSLFAASVLSAALFGVGLVALLLRRHIVFVGMGLFFELLAAATLFVAAGTSHGDSSGEHMAILIVGVGVAHVVVGAAIFLALHRQHRAGHLDSARSLRG